MNVSIIIVGIKTVVITAMVTVSTVVSLPSFNQSGRSPIARNAKGDEVWVVVARHRA